VVIPFNIPYNPTKRPYEVACEEAPTASAIVVKLENITIFVPNLSAKGTPKACPMFIPMMVRGGTFMSCEIVTELSIDLRYEAT